MDSDVFKFVTEGVILTIISTFGFVGNAMSVNVLTRTATGLRQLEYFNFSRKYYLKSYKILRLFLYILHIWYILFCSGGLSGGSSFSNLLRGLAAFDALFLFSAILLFGLPNISTWYNENVFVGGICIVRVLFGLIHTFRTGSVFMTLAVTIERFNGIVFPFRHFSCKKFH